MGWNTQYKIFRTAALDGAFPGITSSTVVPKKVFQEIGGFVVGAQVAEDLDLWARICLHYPYVSSAEPKIIYHIDAENKLTKDVSTILDTIPPFLNSISSYSHGWLKQNTEYYNLTLYLESLKLSVIKRHIVCGDKQKARFELAEIKHKEVRLKKTCIHLATILPSALIPCVVKLMIIEKYL